MGVLIFIIVLVLIGKIPDWITNARYNSTDTSNVNIGKMLEDKYSGVSTRQLKNNAVNGKYDRKTK